MKKTTRSAVVLLSVLASLPTTSFALNPVIQTMYTADPAPMVHDGTLYLFSDHDEDKGETNNFNLKNWVLATTTDMVNWTQHGAIASLRDFPWASKELSGWDGFDNGAWALQAIERDGKWYLYCPVQGRGIGVLVADNPLGPYTDPIKKPLIPGQAGGLYDSIDPTVYIDANGQAYLYWGNPSLWSVKLNKDMISYDTSVGEKGIIGHPMTVKAFGVRTPPDTVGVTMPKPALRGTSYEEGPWLYKRNNLYYLFFAAGPVPEHLGYSTGPTAEGPWTYGGVLMTTQSAWTDHPGVVDYKGKTYLFYHTADLPGGDGFKRSVAVDELKFNPDGSISTMQPTKEGPAPVATLDPYKRVEAETIAWSSGVKIEPSSAGGQNVRDIHDGDYIRVNNVDFGATGAHAFMASLSSTAKAKEATGAKIEIRLGKLDGQLIGTLPVSGTGGEWKPQFARISGASGIHDLFFVFRGAVGEDLFKFDHWQFSQRGLPAEESYNPILKRDAEGNRLFTADPTALVEGDTLYIYAGRDEASIGAWFNMNEWVCYSTKDMVDWKYEGVVLKATDFAWGAPGTAWACQVVKRHGKYFLYSTTGRPDRQGYTVGVAVSDRPTGPFVDAIGGPLFDNAITTGDSLEGIEDIDPTVFVDDDGQAYLYWGNRTLHYALLNEDMISLKDLNGDGKITEGSDIFSKIEIKDRPMGFGEAPWLYKANGKYYLVDAMDMPQKVVYAMSDSPRGPWQYKGVILNENRRPDGSQGDFSSDTSHPAVIEFKGQWYVFYHNAAQPTGGQTRRSVCVEKMRYNADGTIARSFITSTGPTGGAVRIQSGGQADQYVTFLGFDVKLDTLPADDRAFRWDVTQGLADETTLDTVSMQSVAYPGYYLTVKGDAVVLEKNDASVDFRRRATFKLIPVPSDKNLTAFQSLADPSRYLRRSAVTGKLTAEIITSVATSADKSDATFKFISDADAH